MLDLFGEVIIDQPLKRIGKPPTAKTVWLIASWYAPDGRWKLWPDQWLTHDKAEAVAINDISQVRGHTHYTILEVRLPGEIMEAKP